MQRVRLELEPDEYNGLVRLSKREIRPVPAQARYIVRRELEAAGVLSPGTALSDSDRCPEKRVL
jgi:hypothetical protein